MEHLRLWFESPVLFQPGDILCLLFLQYDIEDLDKNGLGSKKFRQGTSILDVVFC